MMTESQKAYLLTKAAHARREDANALSACVERTLRAIDWLDDNGSLGVRCVGRPDCHVSTACTKDSCCSACDAYFAAESLKQKLSVLVDDRLPVLRQPEQTLMQMARHETVAFRGGEK